MKAHVAACLSVTFLVLWACFAVNASAPVKFMALQPRRSVRPLDTMHITIWTERDALNRSLELRVSGNDFDRASAVPLNGEQAARVTEFWWATFIPCGDYQWTATTFDESGTVIARATDRSEVCVLRDGP